MVKYAQSVKEGYQATSDAMKAETDAYNLAHKTWVEGMMELKQSEGTPIYPDANSTLRLTYGKIGSYSPKDGATYKYYTTLKGVMEKEDPNNWEFVVPKRLKELYNSKDFSNGTFLSSICFNISLRFSNPSSIVSSFLMSQS